MMRGGLNKAYRHPYFGVPSRAQVRGGSPHHFREAFVPGLHDTLAHCGRCSNHEGRSSAIEDDTPKGHFALHTHAAASKKLAAAGLTM